MLGGGFMRGDAVMLAGSAGMGKTTFALEYLINGVRLFNENGIYVTFEQLPHQLYRDAMSMGWDLRELEREEKFRIICTSPDLLLESEGGRVLDQFLKDIHPKRVVIDSLSHMSMFVPEEKLRTEMYSLVMYLKTKGLSSLLIWESSSLMGQATQLSEAGISFLVDAIVMLKPVEIQSSVRKALAILKTRGSDHDKRLTEFDITSEGIKLKAPFLEYEGLMSGNPRRAVRLSEDDLLKKGMIRRK
jgi:circadian clock protein KaiC